MSRKCEYWGLTITCDTNVSSHALKTCDLTRLLYHALFSKPYTHISALTVLALLKIVEKAIRNTNERKYPFHSSMFLLNVTVKVNVVTCEYNDFYLTA